MATTEQEMQYFRMVPMIPTDSAGRKVLTMTYHQKVQAAHMKGISLYELEAELTHMEKIGFWKREDNETYVVNPEYCKADFQNMSRLEQDANNK